MRRTLQTLLFFWLIGCTHHVCYSQDSIDSVVVPLDSSKVKMHSPKLATIMSAIIPGSGQVYNKKYWKVPIIYAALGLLGYLAIDNLQEYNDLKTAYVIRVDTVDHTWDKYDVTSPFYSGGEAYTESNLLVLQSSYRKNMELSFMGMALFYILNIVDAAVDAHLFNFDVSDDLSLEWSPDLRPTYYSRQPYTGISLTLKL